MARITKKRAPAGLTAAAARVRVVAVTPRRTDSPAPTHFERWSVTPALALEWLEKMGANRSVAQRYVEAFARDMRAGEWTLNGETIKFDVQGRLVDGQHRLWAVVQADVTVEMDVARDVPEAAMQA